MDLLPLLSVLCLVFLLFIPLQPWDPLLLMPLSIPLPPFLVLIFWLTLPSAAFPPVFLCTLLVMEKMPDLPEAESPKPEGLLSTPMPDPVNPLLSASAPSHKSRTHPSAAAVIQRAVAELVRLRRMTPAPRARELRSRATDIAFGAAAGTSHRLLLTWELSAALMAGCCQAFIQYDEFRARPRQISCAILLATAMAVLWHRLWATTRERSFIDKSSAQPESLLRILWAWTALTILSGGWVWAMVFIIASPTTRPNFQVRIQLAAMIQGSLLLVNTILDSASALIDRLKRRPHRGHDDPVMELPRAPAEALAV